MQTLGLDDAPDGHGIDHRLLAMSRLESLSEGDALLHVA